MPTTRSAGKRSAETNTTEIAVNKRAKKPKGVEESKKTKLKPAKKTKATAEEEGVDQAGSNATSIYEFKANNIQGEEISLDKYAGHVCIIVNVASRCGHTKSNYEQLVKLHEEYGDGKGLKILAFPCNQFGSQEPGDSAKICKFAEDRNVKFDMFEKINVNGPNAHPLWNYLKSKLEGPNGKNIKWNFTKFIIDKSGQPVERFTPTTKPVALVDTLAKYW